MSRGISQAGHFSSEQRKKRKKAKMSGDCLCEILHKQPFALFLLIEKG
jgi:hypothetical protein